MPPAHDTSSSPSPAAADAPGKIYRVGIIGAGNRARPHAAEYHRCGDVAVAAIADPVPAQRRRLIEAAGLSNSVAEYDDLQAMLAAEQLDGVVITTPNHLHADHAVPCLERGLPVLLEKPLATTPEDCLRIVRAEQRTAGRMLLGFVLRSTPFYAKIRDLLAGGAIGRVFAIQADEIPSLSVTSGMNRSPWRRYTGPSGGTMLEKCCHDMDIFNWLMESRPTALASFGGRRIILPDPSKPRHCRDCAEAESCLYHPRRVRPLATDEQLAQWRDAECIYNLEKDTKDLQSVCIEYETGGLVNFLLAMVCGGDKGQRNFAAQGTTGRLWGNSSEHTIHVYDYFTRETATHHLLVDRSGHGGGDRAHILLLRRMMQDPDYVPAQGGTAGYLSAMMCFAADRSCDERRRIAFEYDPSGEIRLR